jgi:hypothetical protein
LQVEFAGQKSAATPSATFEEERFGLVDAGFSNSGRETPIPEKTESIHQLPCDGE